MLLLLDRFQDQKGRNFHTFESFDQYQPHIPPKKILLLLLLLLLL